MHDTSGFNPAYAHMLLHAPFQPEERVLDVGGGCSGIWESARERLAASGRAVLLDLSEEALRIAKSRRGDDPRLQLTGGDAECLPFRADSFHLLTMRSVLIYVSRKDRAFREFYRALKPEGWMCLCEPLPGQLKENPEFDWGRWKPIREAIEEMRDASRHDPSFQAGMECEERHLTTLIHEAGFRLVREEREFVPKMDTGSREELFYTWKPPNRPTDSVIPWQQRLSERFSTQEVERFADFASEAMRMGQLVVTLPVLYLWAQKPS